MTQIAQVDNRTLKKISDSGDGHAWQQNHGTLDGNAHAIKGDAVCIWFSLKTPLQKPKCSWQVETVIHQIKRLNLYVQSLLEHICQ